MPSIFSTLKTRKKKAHTFEMPKRPSAPTPTPLPNHNNSPETRPGSSSRHSQANEGQGGNGAAVEEGSLSVSPPLPSPRLNPSERKSSNHVLAILPPTPKTLAQPELSRIVSQNPSMNLTRKGSRVSFSDMKLMGGGGHGKKSQHQDKDPLGDTKTQGSTMEVGNGAASHSIHGIMKTATNGSVGVVGMHSVRFTLDLPPQLDLDLSLSGEKGEGGCLGRKDGEGEGEGLVRKPSRWGRKTTEAVLDRSEAVSTEFTSDEDGGGARRCAVLNNPTTDKAVQPLQESGCSRTSSISTVECEPSFTVYGLEDLAAGRETGQNVKRALPLAPNPDDYVSGPERVFSRNAMVGYSNGIDGGVGSSASSRSGSGSRRETVKGYDGCVSA